MKNEKTSLIFLFYVKTTKLVFGFIEMKYLCTLYLWMNLWVLRLDQNRASKNIWIFDGYLIFKSNIQFFKYNFLKIYFK